MTSIKVSIIIPVYNVEKYISDCLLSVMKQKYPNLECILVDDCGTDLSMKTAVDVIAAYDGSILFKVVRHERNRGLSAARNTGIRNAQGDYLYFLDSDDEITVNSIQLLVNKVEQYHPDLVIGNFEYIPGYIKNQIKFDKEYITEYNEIIKAYCKSLWPVIACNKLVRRNFLLQNNLYFKEGIIHEDNLWSFQIALKCRSVAIEYRTTYLYRERIDSIVKKPFGKKNIDGILCALCYMDSIRKSLHNADIDTCFETSVVGLVMTINKNNNLNLRDQVNKIKKMLDLSLLNPVKRRSLKGVLKLLAFHMPLFLLPYYLQLLSLFHD